MDSIPSPPPPNCHFQKAVRIHFVCSGLLSFVFCSPCAENEFPFALPISFIHLLLSSRSPCKIPRSHASRRLSVFSTL